MAKKIKAKVVTGSQSKASQKKVTSRRRSKKKISSKKVTAAKKQTVAMKARPRSKGERVTDEKVELNWSHSESTTESSSNDGESKKGLSDVVRKLITSGVTSGFMTEEGLRSYLNDVKLPTDVLSQILKGAKKSRDEVIGKAGNELVKLIRKMDLSAEFRKLLVDNKIKIHAEIDFVPKDKSEQADESSHKAPMPEKRERDPNQTEFFES